MVGCYVPHCPSNSSKSKKKETLSGENTDHVNQGNSEHRHFFSPTKDPELLKQWVETIRRKDQVLDSRRKICDLHFHSEEIIKEDVFILTDGKRHVIPRDKWALKPHAIPSLNLNLGINFIVIKKYIYLV